ncbi:MAG: hypothetical protein GY699_00655 [Desulfobacteraceae bacterium]|nr:hypothetical protein [Desulfobacteraceae bacterium]
MESERKIHPKWLEQYRQTHIFHENPENHENSVEDIEVGLAPPACEKHPISNTIP